MRRFIIPEDILKNIIAYLQKRPYEEVFQGIQILSNLEELKEKDETPTQRNTDTK